MSLDREVSAMGRNWTTVLMVVGALLMYLALAGVMPEWGWSVGFLILIGLVVKWLVAGAPK